MSQTWNPDLYAANARFVSDLATPAVEWLAPRPGERILDLGCGDGVLTARLRDLGCEMVGVDASPAFVRAATALGLDARLMDGHGLAFETEFDAVFSNAALHWMTRPDAVIDGAWHALRPGGRFVGEFGGQGNVATIVAALYAALERRGIEAAALDPWYFPAPGDYRARLEARGFRVEAILLTPRPTVLPADMRGWLATFADAFVSALPQPEREGLVSEVVDLLRPELCDASGTWTADYVRLRFSAMKPTT